jgi:hypothetical protein
VIPWHRTQFRGFIVGLRMPGPDGRPTLHRFATYTGARTTQLRALISCIEGNPAVHGKGSCPVDSSSHSRTHVGS